jgi:proliferating cell nuclear antigen
MDGSHVALVSMNLDKEGFDFFKVDKDMVLGLNI